MGSSVPKKEEVRAEYFDLKPVDRRARKVHKGDINEASASAASTDRAFPLVKRACFSLGFSRSVLLLASAGHKVRVVGLAIGCIGDLSSGFDELSTFIARNLTVEHLQCYDNKTPEQALNIFRMHIQPVWGHAAIFDWADLIFGLSRALVGPRSPEAVAAAAAAAAATAAAAADPDLDNCDLYHVIHPDVEQGVKVACGGPIVGIKFLRALCCSTTYFPNGGDGRKH